MSIEKLAAELVHEMRDIMSQADSDLEERQILKIMFLEFATVGRKKRLSIMPHVVAKFIEKEYPHLKEDLDKLLILT